MSKQRRSTSTDSLFEHMQKGEPVERNCSTFGCKNKLSITEQMYGNRCPSCREKKKLNLTSIISKL